jgi:hypothetical protein
VISQAANGPFSPLNAELSTSVKKFYSSGHLTHIFCESNQPFCGLSSHIILSYLTMYSRYIQVSYLTVLARHIQVSYLTITAHLTNYFILLSFLRCSDSPSTDNLSTDFSSTDNWSTAKLINPTHRLVDSSTA